MEAKYKVGDKVRVLKPKNRNEYPLFVDTMDKFIGCTYEIDSAKYSDTNDTWAYTLKEDRFKYYFRESWLEPVNLKGTIKNEIPVNKLLLLT